MTRYFETIKNDTSQILRLSYWRSKTAGCSENITVSIESGKTITIPSDNSVDEFYISSENYAHEFFKFWQEPCASGNRLWEFYSCIKTDINTDQKSITVSDA